MMPKRIIVFFLSMLCIAGCAFTGDESVDDDSTEVESVTEATEATVIAPPPVTIQLVSNPTFPNINVPKDTDAGLMHFKFVCSTPGCNVGPITLRSSLIFGEPYSPVNLYDMNVWVNNVRSGKRAWDLHHDGGMTFVDFTADEVFAPLSPYSGNSLYHAAKSFTLGGLTTTEDISNIQVGDTVSFSAKHDGTKPPASVTMRLVSYSNNFTDGAPTRELPAISSGMYAGGSGKLWFFKNDAGDILRPSLLFKVQGKWYPAAAGPYNLTSQFTTL